MKHAEGQWIGAATIGALCALAVFAARESPSIGAWLGLGFGAAFGFGWRHARQHDIEAERADVRTFGKRGA